MDRFGLGWSSGSSLYLDCFSRLWRYSLCFLDGLAGLFDFEGVLGLDGQEVVLGGVDVGEVVIEGNFADAAVAVIFGGSGNKL